MILIMKVIFYSNGIMDIIWYINGIMDAIWYNNGFSYGCIVINNGMFLLQLI